MFHSKDNQEWYMTHKQKIYSVEHCQSGASAISNQQIFDWLDKTPQ
jgi:hypothetical protein